MKRKHVHLSCLLLLILFDFPAFAQDVAPFQLEEENIIELNQKLIDDLVDKSWYCTMRKYNERGVWYNNKSAWGFLKLEKDGISLHNNHEGTWFVDDNKILYLDFESEDYNSYKVWLAGGYVVLKATKDELIIRKSLTSAFDNDFTYFFETEERLKARIVAQKAKKRAEQENLEEVSFNKMTRVELVEEVNKLFLLKGIKPKSDPAEMTKPELIKQLKSLNNRL